MHPEHPGHAWAERPPVTIHQPTPIPPTTPAAAPLAPVQPGTVPAVTSVVLPDGRIVTGYTLTPTTTAQPVPATFAAQTQPAVSRTAVNVALGGVGFCAVCGGLFLLTSFVAALTAFVTQLVILAAVCFGGWIAVQVFGGKGGGTTVNIRKAVFKRNTFNG